MSEKIPPRSRGILTTRAGHSYVARQLLLPMQRFIHTETSSGVVLLGAALVAIVWANSPWAHHYFHLWEIIFTVDLHWLRVSKTFHHWINDGLMTVFFFVVGLEIKRELVGGQLADPRKAALPCFAALGGMLAPVALFLLWAEGEATRGWGITMATDIAFALGVLALLGNKIPAEIRIVLLALAIVDDIGSILVIALFYTQDLSWPALASGLLLLVGLTLLIRLGVTNRLIYLSLAIAVWLAVLKSGVHATISGVLLGAITPLKPHYGRQGLVEAAEKLMARFQQAIKLEDRGVGDYYLGELEELTRNTEAPLVRIERVVHPWSSFLVLPLFAFANAGVEISGPALRNALSSTTTQGIVLGLVVGKLVGVSLFCWVTVRLGLSALPGRTSWHHIIGMSMLAGIGFTVSLFITNLAYTDPQMVSEAKTGILVASALAAILGSVFLLVTRDLESHTR